MNLWAVFGVASFMYYTVTFLVLTCDIKRCPGWSQQIQKNETGQLKLYPSNNVTNRKKYQLQHGKYHVVVLCCQPQVVRFWSMFPVSSYYYCLYSLGKTVTITADIINLLKRVFTGREEPI